MNSLSIPANEIRSVWRKPMHFIAFGFGSGAARWAPGTFGTLAAIPIYGLMMDLSPWLYALLTLLFIVASVPICHYVAKDLGVHDYPGIVLDEIVGYLLTMLWVPVGWFWVILGFVLFRVFDIWKPWPIHWVDDRVEGGLGIVLDDLIAAIYAWIVLQLVAAVWIYYQ